MKAITVLVPTLACLSIMLAPSPTRAQQHLQSARSPDNQDNEEPVVQRQQAPLLTNPVGRTAQSSAGEAGQRQTRYSAAQQTGIKPMARIDSRIQNRVQSRIRNRIDRYYIPGAIVSDPFVTAEDQTRATGRPR